MIVWVAHFAKRYNPHQPRWPKGVPTGGQWREVEGPDGPEPIHIAEARRKYGDAHANFLREHTDTFGVQVEVTPVGSNRGAFHGGPPTDRRRIPHNKPQTGDFSESIVASYLRSIGATDAKKITSKVEDIAADIAGTSRRGSTTKKTNSPFDVHHDHELIEVKGGQTSNTLKARQTRVTEGQITAKEQAIRDKLRAQGKGGAAAKRADEAIERAMDRKYEFAQMVGEQLGHKQRVSTFVVIYDRDRRVADLYRVPGVHRRLDWGSGPGASVPPEIGRDGRGSGYLGSFAYKVTEYRQRTKQGWVPRDRKAFKHMA